jgi:hypothetical protein
MEHGISYLVLPLGCCIYFQASQSRESLARSQGSGYLVHPELFVRICENRHGIHTSVFI